MNLESSQESREKPKPKALLVDDDGDLIYMMAERLDTTGCDVIAAECHSLEDVRKAVEDNRPDIVFLDHNLSGVSSGEGIVIAKEIMTKFPKTKIYSTTSSAEAVPDYEVLNIEHVGKSDRIKIESILEAASSANVNASNHPVEA